MLMALITMLKFLSPLPLLILSTHYHLFKYIDEGPMYSCSFYLIFLHPLSHRLASLITGVTGPILG